MFLFVFVCAGPRDYIVASSDGSSLRDITSSPERSVAGSIVGFPDWRHSRLASLFQAGGIAWEYGRDPTASSILTPQ